MSNKNVPALNAGGSVAAIVPQSVEEMFRIGQMVMKAGLAPYALIAKKTGEDAVSAICTAIMAGAELGLPPMVSLRSFTVIGGRPALYGDGLINVVRRSRKAAYIRMGYHAEKGVGWCEAKRADTGEEARAEFSIDDARRAGLWDERETVRRKGRDGNWGDLPNESPWHRYPQRMLQWRAAGYCLRELFADVLGGITDEYEAREIARAEDPAEPPMRDITPPSPPSPDDDSPKAADPPPQPEAKEAARSTEPEPANAPPRPTQEPEERAEASPPTPEDAEIVPPATEAPDAPGEDEIREPDIDELLDPTSEFFSIDAYKEATEAKFGACQDLDALGEAFDYVVEELFEYAPDGVRRQLQDMYVRHEKRIKTG